MKNIAIILVILEISQFLLLAPIAFADKNQIAHMPETASQDGQITYIPEFVGGLNLSQIIHCEHKYQKSCADVTAKLIREKAGITQALHASQRCDCGWGPCIDKKINQDKFCAQASLINQLAYYPLPSTEIKKYGPIAVFYTTSIADAQQSYYMVDTKGRLISLATDFDLSANKNYLRLKKKYPNIALTTSPYWIKVNENLFPKSHILSNKKQQLIFKQALKDSDCVACPMIGRADIAYEFDQKGVYLRSKLLTVTPRP